MKRLSGNMSAELNITRGEYNRNLKNARKEGLIEGLNKGKAEGIEKGLQIAFSPYNSIEAKIRDKAKRKYKEIEHPKIRLAKQEKVEK